MYLQVYGDGSINMSDGEQFDKSGMCGFSGERRGSLSGVKTT